MAMNLKLTTGTIGNYNNITTKENGTIYFATDEDGRAYIYFNDKNIVPKMADLRNGGLGADYSNSVNYPAYSILMLGSDGKTTTTRAPAAGAFYTDAASNKPKFGTLPVAQGGLGITSITKGAILYGNTSSTTGAVSALSPGTNGYVLVSTGSAPKYVQPTMSWTNGSAAGPIFNFTFNGTSIAGAAIPAATDSISGIITTGAQTMTGEKTWMSTTHSSSIYPRTTNAYSLGYWTTASDHKIWNNVFSRGIQIFGTDGYNGGQFNCHQGVTYLVIGNDIATGTTGASQGIIHLYNTNKYYTKITYNAEAAGNSHFVFPTPGVNTYITPSRMDAMSGKTVAGSYSIPYYWYTGQSMSLVYDDGFKLIRQDGDPTTTTSGRSELQLGNNIAIGTADNKRGKLRLYGDSSGQTTLQSNNANGTSNYTVSLPAADGELVYHTEDAAQGGSGRLISVSANGQIIADTSTDIASDIKLMYLKDGLLTASTAEAGANNQFIYLSDGTITASTLDIGTDGKSILYFSQGKVTKSTTSVAHHKQLMYLGSGMLSASDADEGSNVKPVYLSKGVITAFSSTIASSTQLMYMNSGALTPSTADVGSATQPVYLLDGVVTPADAYSTLLTTFSGSASASDNTMSITVGGTTKDATIIGGVSNSWANGTAAGPTLSTTVNGKAGTAVAIPSASYSYSGIITTGDQTVKGVKTFASGIKVAGSNSTSDCATFTYDASTDTLTVNFPN